MHGKFIYIFKVYAYFKELDDVQDITDGKGGQIESTILKNLASDTTYKLYLVAGNTKGNATKSNVVTFTTTGKTSRVLLEVINMTLDYIHKNMIFQSINIGFAYNLVCVLLYFCRYSSTHKIIKYSTVISNTIHHSLVFYILL